MNAIDRDALREWARKRIEFYQQFDSDFAKGLIAGLDELIEKIQFGAFDIKPHEGRTGQAIRVPGESNGRMKPMTDTEKKIAEIRKGISPNLTTTSRTKRKLSNKIFVSSCPNWNVKMKS